MGKPKAYTNPLSPGLHLIPAHCPICGQIQYDGVKARDSEAPYGDGSGIDDLCLNIDRDLQGLWTVCHVVCKAWFRDETVNRLLELANSCRLENDEEDEPAMIEVDKIHEAIRNSISAEHGEDVLIAMLGPGYHIPNPTADAIGWNLDH